MNPVEALAMVGGYVDEEMLARNEYLANRVISNILDPNMGS